MNGIAHHEQGQALPGLCLLIALWLLWSAGCATPGKQNGQNDLFPNQRAIIGKTQQELLACAGTPLRETRQADHTLLIYYKQVPILDRSTVASKGSRPALRHACWATVSIEGERVTAAQYQSVPSSSDATDQCEAIFDPCS
jgi:hypothetical protein